MLQRESLLLFQSQVEPFNRLWAGSEGREGGEDLGVRERLFKSGDSFCSQGVIECAFVLRGDYPEPFTSITLGPALVHVGHHVCPAQNLGCGTPSYSRNN